MNPFKKPILSHLLNLNDCSRDDLLYLIHRAIEFRDDTMNQHKIQPLLTGRVVTALFFEPSTRTLNSFILAASRLNAITLTPHLPYSSTLKGETILDTIHTFEAMGTEIFIIRHKQNYLPQEIAAALKTSARIINAGDGTNHHPTQALLDLMTIYECKKTFEGLSVGIVGDINHSRVARSLVSGLHRVGVTDIRLIGPPTLTDQVELTQNVRIFQTLSQGLKDCDVVIALRIQEERFSENETIDLATYRKDFCIDEAALDNARPDAIIMHPGPLNRNVEITSKVADSTRSMIALQVKNGVAMRMAILDTLS